MSGLSQLQLSILRVALDNRAYMNSGVELPRNESGYWTLRRGCDLMLSDSLHLANTASRRAAQASICRAFSRLESRGFVIRHRGWSKWSGIKVTSAGEQWLTKSHGETLLTVRASINSDG